MFNVLKVHLMIQYPLEQRETEAQGRNIHLCVKQMFKTGSITNLPS